MSSNSMLAPPSGQGKDSLSNIVNDRTNLIKLVVLVLLCCQNAGHALMTRYSQGVLKESYSSTEVVIVSEALKLVVSALNILSDKDSGSETLKSRVGRLLWLIKNSKNVIVLVILYTIQNILAYYALARVEASVYTVVQQLKIFTTAGFSVVLLGKTVSGAKWRALFLLVIGCILVASPTFNQCVCDVGITNRKMLSSASLSGTSSYISSFLPFGSSVVNMVSECDWHPALLTKNIFSFVENRKLVETGSSEYVISFDAILGIFACLVMVTISGYGSVYMARMMKRPVSTENSLWETNFQLAFYSIIFVVGIMIWENEFNTVGSDSEDYIPFKGWTINTVIIMLLQSGGGLLVAATLKYADPILKTLATCGSIVISAILGYFFLGGSLDVIISMGCISTILAIFNYNFDNSDKPVQDTKPSLNDGEKQTA